MFAELALAAMLQVNPADACSSASSPTIASGAPYTVLWVMDATVPTSDTDPTPVPQRLNGFYLQIDTGLKQDIGLATQGALCPVGTANAGKLPFAYRTASGVSKGSHTVTLTAWNYVLDANGTPTTTRQESAAVSLPFTVADPVRTGPPSVPKLIGIRR